MLLIEKRAMTQFFETAPVKLGYTGTVHAGLSKSTFTEISKSIKSYQCTHCKLNVLESEVCSLNDIVKSLSSHLSMVTDQLTSLDEQVKCRRSQIEELQYSQVPSHNWQVVGL